MYKLKSTILTNGEAVTNTVIRITDNAFIPFDPANTDYAEYLKWLAKGNEPLPPEEN